jgi:hypothetical protein
MEGVRAEVERAAFTVANDPRGVVSKVELAVRRLGSVGHHLTHCEHKGRSGVVQP